jgi:hypothetical protein
MLVFEYIVFKNECMSVEKLKWTTLNVLSPKTETPVDYTEILKKLWLTETDIHADIIQRLKEHLTLYKNGVEANLALLEEKISTHPLEERISSLETWMTAERERVTKSPLKNTISEQTIPVANDATKIAQDATANFEADQLAKVSAKIQSNPTLAGIKKIPYIWESIVETLSSWLISTGKDMQSGSAGFLGKILFAVFAGALGLKEVLTAKAPVVPAAAVASTEVGTVLETAPIAAVIEDTVTFSPDAGKEKIKRSTEVLKYTAGFSLLTSLSGEKLENNIGKGQIQKGLADIPYSEFLTSRGDVGFRDRVLEAEKTNPDIISQYARVSDALVSENTKTLLRVGLTSKSVELILMGRKRNKENTKLKESIGAERFAVILAMIHDENGKDFDYTKLSLKELSLLYITSIPVLSSGALLGFGQEMATWIHDLVVSSSLKSEMDSMKENMFSQWLTTKLIAATGLGEDMAKSEEEMIQQLWIIDAKDRTDFQKIYDFGKYVVWDEFLNNKKLTLSTEQKELFRNHMNYKWIFALYNVMGGYHLDELNPVSLVVVVSLMYKIMSSGNLSTDTLTASNWIGNFVKQSIIPEDGKRIFNPDEQAVISIYVQKAIDLAIKAHMDWIYSILWPVWVSKNNLWEAAVIAGGTWLALKYFWVKSTKTALQAGRMPVFWNIARKLWWLWIGVWVFLGGLSIVSGSEGKDRFGEDLNTAYEKGNIEKVLAILQKHKESIQSYKNKAKEDVNVVSYDGEVPYVVHKNTVYQIAVLDKTRSLEQAWFVSYIQGAGVDFVTFWQAEKKALYNNQDISKISVRDGKIILWENVYSVGLEENLGMQNPIHIDETAWERAETLWTAAGETGLWVLQSVWFAEWYIMPEQEERTGCNIYSLWDIPETDFMIWLVPVGEISEIPQEELINS